jgi:hypothetical protein
MIRKAFDSRFVIEQGPLGRTDVTVIDASVNLGMADIVFSRTTGAELNLQRLFVVDVNALALVQSENIGNAELSSTTIDFADISFSNIDVSFCCRIPFLLLMS